MTSKVFITPTKSMEELDLMDSVQACFDEFGGVEKIAIGNIYIKINLTMADITAITTPAVLYATIKVLIKNGIEKERIFVIENTAAGTPTRAVFMVEKLGKRIKKLGATVIYLDEEKSVVLDTKGEILDYPLPFPKVLYDNFIANNGERKATYINMPKLKTHLQTGVTICLKNQHGLIYDKEKIYKHHKIDEKMVEIYEIIKPDFNIVDATTVNDNGVFSFKDDWTVPMDLLLAGIDGVAIDTVGAKLLGIEEVKITQLAGKKGLGESNYENIEVIPSKDIIESKKVKLNDDADEVPLILPKEIQLIKGNDHPGCRGGCQAMIFYLRMLTAGAKCEPLICLIGRGFDKVAIDNMKGPFFVNGPCAVNELKEYFEDRSNKEDIKVFYSDQHFDIGGSIKVAIKAAKVPLNAAKSIMKLPFYKLMLSYAIAGIKRANFISMI